MGTENKYIVYVHISPSGKKYFGITCMPTAQRWKSDGRGYIQCPFFYKAIQKYGWDSFKHLVLIDGLSEKSAKEFERTLICMYRTNEREQGYNLTQGGDGARGRVLSAETIQKMSESAHCRVTTPETRAILSKARMGNQNRWGCVRGRVASDETRLKQSMALKGRKIPPERAARSAAKRCKPVTQYFNGIETARFRSAAAAAEITGCDNSSISECCTGKLKTTGGYSWAFTQHDTSIQKNEVGQPIWLNQ